MMMVDGVERELPVLLTTRQVADLYGVTTQAVSRLAHRGGLRAYRFRSKLVLVDPADAEAYWVGSETEPPRCHLRAKAWREAREMTAQGLPEQV